MIRKGLEFTSDLDGYVEANEKWLSAVSAIDSAACSSRSRDPARSSRRRPAAPRSSTRPCQVVEARRGTLRVVVKLRACGLCC